MDIKIYVSDKSNTYDISENVYNDIIYKDYRKGSAASLNFSFYGDIEIPAIGCCVMLYIDGEGFFKGYIFAVSADKNNNINITAYDQTRYFANKESYVFQNKKTSEVLRMVSKDFNINIGDIEDSSYVIPLRIEENKTIWDIVLNSCDITFESTGKLFIVYDDFGELCLKSSAELVVPVIVSEGITDFVVRREIMSETVNSVKIERVNRKTGIKTEVISKDADDISQWGLLSYTKKISDKNADMKSLADSILKQRNSIKNVLKIESKGDKRLKAGRSFYLSIDTDSYSKNCTVMIDESEHIFSNSGHIMKLSVMG